MEEGENEYIRLHAGNSWCRHKESPAITLIIIQYLQSVHRRHNMFLFNWIMSAGVMKQSKACLAGKYVDRVYLQSAIV